ncbi:MAG: hypothetical protein DRH33_06600 [Candidatus Nealsonbacteria bacterium]|nr:MAG: hypothetical protein DRH33_06600 [Candidatus Nealsonbacteria bacterium]
MSKELSEMNDNKFFHGEKGDRLRIKFDNLQKFKNPYLLIRAAMRAEYPRVDNIIEKIEEISPSPRKLGKFLEKVAISMATVGSLAAALKAAGTVSKYSIHIKMLIKGKKGAEKEIGIVHPRERFSFNLIDISKYIGKTQQSLRLVLEWTQPHNLSFIGLANSNPKDINQLKIEKLKLSELRHSHNADVNKDTLKNGEIELIPGQFLSLEFPAEKAEIGVNQKISFILETKGYYTKI